MAETEWYRYLEGVAQGPCGEDEIRSLLRRGELTEDALVWSSGMAKPTPLHAVPEFENAARHTATTPDEPMTPAGVVFLSVVTFGVGGVAATIAAVQRLEALAGARRSPVRKSVSVMALMFLLGGPLLAWVALVHDMLRPLRELGAQRGVRVRGWAVHAGLLAGGIPLASLALVSLEQPWWLLILSAAWLTELYIAHEDYRRVVMAAPRPAAVPAA